MIPRNVVWNPRVSFGSAEHYGGRVVTIEVRFEAYLAMLGSKDGITRAEEHDVVETVAVDMTQANTTTIRDELIEHAVDHCWAEATHKAMRGWLAGMRLPR